MAQYDLLMAHPSVCSDLESDSHLMDMLKRQPTNVLRYTTAVDILAPLFDMAFFQDSVVNTLQNATYGKPLNNKLQMGAKLCINCMRQVGVHTSCIHAQTICPAKCAVWCICQVATAVSSLVIILPSLSHSPSHTLTHSLTHSFTCSCTVISIKGFDAVRDTSMHAHSFIRDLLIRSLTHSLTHSHTHTPTHPPTHPINHSLACSVACSCM